MILFVMAVRGELATNSREQQEIVTLSLQLLQNCLMLINTILVERTIEREVLWERLSAEDLRALFWRAKNIEAARGLSQNCQNFYYYNVLHMCYEFSL
jgi:hypothetical protein